MEPTLSKQAETEAVSVAVDIKAGRLDLIEGARKLTRLRFRTNNPDDEVFYPFRAIDSETETFLTKAERINFTEKDLETRDKERSEYLEAVGNDVPNYCNDLITRFL